ncbi:MAG: hypothetical protein II812_05100, partial [Prevotella sp.]|nr:hypothetical protein [Prevotella sp.]
IFYYHNYPNQCSSLGFGREKEPRETMLHASSQIKSQFLTFCCGTRFAQTSPRNGCATMFDHWILLLPLSLSQQFSI